MGWIQRGSKRYYYRSKRVGGRIRTEAFSGLRAELEARADDEAREARRREREQIAEDRELDAELDQLFGKLEELTAYQLEGLGYHCRQGEWRRRRNRAA